MSKSYTELLKDERWKWLSSTVKQRDNFTCQRCGSIENLEVHHTKYTSYLPWETPEQYLITLCYDCHKAAHYNDRSEKAAKWWEDIKKMAELYGTPIRLPLDTK